MKLVEYPDRDLLIFTLADTLASELGAALRQNPTASLCVPGGTTPGPVFDVLAAVHLEWERVTVFLNVERWVPEDNPRSNAAQLRRRLLTGPAARATLLPFYSGGDAPDPAMPDLAARLAPHLPISVLLLGMGEDMHTASLFPGGDRLDEALAPDAPAVLAMRAPAAPEPRVTLSARTLADAMSVHVLITGAAKRAALERAQGLAAADAPVRSVLDVATVHWAE